VNKFPKTLGEEIELKGIFKMPSLWARLSLEKKVTTKKGYRKGRRGSSDNLTPVIISWQSPWSSIEWKKKRRRLRGIGYYCGVGRGCCRDLPSIERGKGVATSKNRVGARG